MKRNFFLRALDFLFENTYFFCALINTYMALRSIGTNPVVSHGIFAVVMFFFWIADRIKIERQRAHKDLTAEIQSRVEAETNRIKVVLLDEIRSVRG